MAFLRRWYDIVTGHEKLSEPARLIGRTFDDESTVGQPFFDTILARFDNFDQHNAATKDRSFSDDVNLIVKCVAEILSSSPDLHKFSERIDAYLYVFHRIEEYLAIIKRTSVWSTTLENSVKDLKTTLLHQLTSVFTNSNGRHPNLCTRNNELLERMSIDRYLKSMKTIKKNELNLFFALCKVSLQALLLIRGNNRGCWRDIISNVDRFEMSLQEFTACYIDFSSAFEEFKLDTTAFVELIRKLHPTNADESPFVIMIRLAKSLALNIDEFFDQFRPMFDSRVKERLYKLQHVSDLFTRLSSGERLFTVYFSIFASHVETDTLWHIYLHICKNGPLSEGIQNYLITHLSNRASNVSIETFQKIRCTGREVRQRSHH